MKISTIDVAHSSNLVNDYMNHDEKIMKFFEYNLNQHTMYQDRYGELQQRSFQRDELCDYLYNFNKKYNAPHAVFENIEQLRDKRSVAVVGGQQAGLLTGPSLTIHKCLSIIQLAKQQEEALGVPVVPVFWIAGEDHDFQEINHVYVYSHGIAKKKAYHDFVEKQSASKLMLNKKKVLHWLEDIVSSFGETNHTGPLLASLKKHLESSHTIVDFFTRLLHHLFGEYGLVLLDSGDPSLRQIEGRYFEQLVQNNRSINDAVLQQMSSMKEQGYQPTIDQLETSANLFYELDGDRELLEWKEGCFRGKTNRCIFTKEELLNISVDSPQLLSNNVVTRPLMQDLLIPTLAFVAGPGEISYWATLKEAFRSVSCQMPPVVPRLNITIVDRGTAKWLNEMNLTIEQVIIEGIHRKKEQWIKSQDEWDIDGQVTKAINELQSIHKPLEDLAVTIDPHLKMLSQKNLDYLKNQIHYLQNKIEKGLKRRYEGVLSKFDHVEMMIKPQNQLQERVWNIFYFINLYGEDLIAKLMMQHYTFDHKHIVYYL